MNKYVLIALLFIPMIVNASTTYYVCDMQHANNFDSGLKVSEVIGKATVTDNGNSFVALVKDGVSIQSPELTNNGKNLNGYSKDGTEFIKGDGFFIIGDDSSGYILTSCMKK